MSSFSFNSKYFLLSLFLLWLTYNLEVCYLASKYLKILQKSLLLISILITLWSENISVWPESFYKFIKTCSMTQNWSKSMFYVHLKRIWIWLFGGRVFHKSQIDRVVQISYILTVFVSLHYWGVLKSLSLSVYFFSLQLISLCLIYSYFNPIIRYIHTEECYIHAPNERPFIK